MLECPEEAWHGWVSKGLVCLRNGTELHLSCPDICVCVYIHYLVVVLNISYFHPYLGKIPILTNIFQMG